MKKSVLYGCLFGSMWLVAGEMSLDRVVIEEKMNNLSIHDLSNEEIKSVDLADALSRKSPSVSLVRRSGAANDIILRGQKRDNINILVDGAKIYGACPNRMDPPTSHIVTHLVEDVQVQEGPFDVENFGTLSGLVSISTKEPKEGFSGDIGLGLGSFGYQKGDVTLQGGNRRIKALITLSHEKSGAYEDGAGDDFYGQLYKQTVGTKSEGTQYQPRYKEMDAYTKRSLIAKLFVHPQENQTLKLSYMGNRSDDVLYPSSKMDAIWDDSDIYNASYEIDALSRYSKQLKLSYYRSQVDHPMSIKYRKSAKKKGNITNHLYSEIEGWKLKNHFDIQKMPIMIGLDYSTRSWDGGYFKDVKGDAMHFPAKSATAGVIKKSIDDATTVNRAVFATLKREFSQVTLESGLRYDDTEISYGTEALNRDFQTWSGNIFATIMIDDSLRYFVGAGKSSRVPDARELYFQSSMQKSAFAHVGTPTLNATDNYEVDMGFEKIYDAFRIKTKLFYSSLRDYIYLNADKKENVFENIDATIYGAEISGTYLLSDALYLDYSLAYKKGEKSHPLAGQRDKDLADISPTKALLGLGYMYDDSLDINMDMTFVDGWHAYDSDNGEQELDGYMLCNLKVQKTFESGITLALGVDNLFDETFTTTNTYKDLTLVTTSTSLDTAANRVMLLNDPGRYFYLDMRYQF